MKIYHNKHDVQQFAHDLKVVEKMIDMSDQQIVIISRNHFLQK